MYTTDRILGRGPPGSSASPFGRAVEATLPNHDREAVGADLALA